MTTFSEFVRREEIEIRKPERRNPSFDDEVEFVYGDIGRLKLAKSQYSPTDWSVIETYVNESDRRQGIASALIDKAKETLQGTIGAQASSDGSAILYWQKGFRPFNGGTLEDALKTRRENSSVLLVYDPNKGV